jgi:hypothetical protein
MRQKRAIAGLSIGLFLSLPASATPMQDGNTRHSVASDTGLATWETDNSGVHLRLTQISPDQARAFMQARGLDEKSVDEFARTCVYMGVLRNDSKQPIKYCLADWRYVPEGKTAQLMLTKHDWLARWQPRKFSKPVKLAFEWSQLPVEQTFAPGDWNQGMTTFELPAGSRFDVLYRWWQDGRLYEGVLQNVQCAARAD